MLRRLSAAASFLAAACLLAAGAAARGEDPPEQQDVKKATADGKYTKLLAVINVPADRGDYGLFNDYGISDGGDWGGYKGLPRGYWVYVYPHWFIWEKEGKRGGEGVDLVKASADGKYSKLLAVIYVPDDKASYGAFNDNGLWEKGDYAGYGGLPRGYWVYVAPRWYIWKRSKD